ncbi:hypothetical protein H0E84_17720 [Luteimonas sp. SJ-92]|uniref:Uncharacterized protein n=1 Tax=Luteimonas salinisoli TaxID=2752307 RepID=A0A853JFV0_9GAMM|nr:hypothetical protein [Luteimonas salinisoli]NZA28216.1 hypothetical protein [Luteimonas salinisoli]
MLSLDAPLALVHVAVAGESTGAFSPYVLPWLEYAGRVWFATSHERAELRSTRWP